MHACPFLHPAVTPLPGIRFPLRPANATGARVTTAFGRALDVQEPPVLAELRAATVAFAATLKAEGHSPGEALIALKRAIEGHGWWPSLVPPRQAEWEEQPPEYRLYLRVFGWLLEGYFGAPR